VERLEYYGLFKQGSECALYDQCDRKKFGNSWNRWAFEQFRNRGEKLYIWWYKTFM